MKVEINRAIAAKPSSEISDGLGGETGVREEASQKGADEGIEPKKNRMSVMDQLKALPMSVSSGFLGPKKNKKGEAGGSGEQVNNDNASRDASVAGVTGRGNGQRAESVESETL